jgi:hypothetical protein
MLKEAGIILSAIGCIFLIIPLARISFYSPASLFVSMVLFVIVLLFAAFDVQKLCAHKEYRLAKTFILLLFLSIVISIIALVAIWRYTLPPIIA